jgi:hypothetical protein
MISPHSLAVSHSIPPFMRKREIRLRHPHHPIMCPRPVSLHPNTLPLPLYPSSDLPGRRGGADRPSVETYHCNNGVAISPQLTCRFRTPLTNTDNHRHPAAPSMPAVLVTVSSGCVGFVTPRSGCGGRWCRRGGWDHGEHLCQCCCAVGGLLSWWLRTLCCFSHSQRCLRARQPSAMTIHLGSRSPRHNLFLHASAAMPTSLSQRPPTASPPPYGALSVSRSVYIHQGPVRRLNPTPPCQTGRPPPPPPQPGTSTAPSNQTLVASLANLTQTGGTRWRLGCELGRLGGVVWR